MVFNDNLISQFYQRSILLVVAVFLSACGSHTYHQVRPNDTLYSISWNYNQDYRKVAEWNGLTPPYVIKKGQWLRVAPPTGPDAWGRGAEPAFPSVPNNASRAESKPHPSPTISKQSSPPSARSSERIEPVPTKAVIASVPEKIDRWLWPVKGDVVRTYDAKKPGRQGIDIAGTLGTPVKATADGKVVYSGNALRGYGNLVIIKHNEKFLSAYAHNSRIVVKEGHLVKQGDTIAYLGKTEAERAKLHFQIRIDGKPVDPLRYLPK